MELGAGWGGGCGLVLQGGSYLFAHLLIVSTCSGKEDHLLGYHAGPRSQSSRPPAPPPPPATPLREGRDLVCHVLACSEGAKGGSGAEIWRLRGRVRNPSDGRRRRGGGGGGLRRWPDMPAGAESAYGGLEMQQGIALQPHISHEVAPPYLGGRGGGWGGVGGGGRGGR